MMTVTPKGTVFLISLGCAKNLVDSEHMLGLIGSRGFALARHVDGASVVVINTCGFIQDAVEEAIDAILEVVAFKRQGKVSTIVVVGCLVQRYGNKLLKEIPEVDGWLGTGAMNHVADFIDDCIAGDSPALLINRPTYLADHTVPRVYTSPVGSAFLKIAEGCAHRCSFCMIPRLRGPFRSRRPESLISEAADMIGRGVKEINVIAQDTTWYGKDLDEGICLEGVLEGLVKLEGVEWIRLLYCHPQGISDRLLELMDSEHALCPYLDLPLQHVNGELLKAMGRDPDKERPWEVIQRVKSCKRQISLRTTLMVGFPGETEEMFDELCEFLTMARFDHVGVFAFSPEQGTRAARLESALTPQEARRRRDTLMGIQAEISLQHHQHMVGHDVPVLIEGPSPETDLLLAGRTARMAPDVDGRVLINRGTGVPGEIMPVRITQAYEYDVIGEICE